MYISRFFNFPGCGVVICI